MDSFHTLTMFASAALAGCTTEMITLPFDTVKVRLQQVDAQSFLKKYKTEEKKILFSFFPFNISSKFLESLRQMKRLEGFSSWYRGLTPGLCRQIIFAGSRITLYPHLRDCLINWNENSIIILPNLFNQITAGIFAGAIGITLANPADLIKICMQSNNLLTRNSSSHVKDKFKPKNMQTVLIELYKTNGIKSFWKGYIPNVLRNCIISSTELVVYDLIKNLCALHYSNNTLCHCASGFAAGVTAAVIGSPVDVIKTRYMLSSGTNLLSLYNQIKASGYRTFYKGLTPNMLRLGFFNMLIFVFYEKYVTFIKNL